MVFRNFTFMDLMRIFANLDWS